MSTCTLEIDKLFNSTGFFLEEYKETLHNFDLEEQNIFISELYRRITSEQYKHQQGKDAFGVTKEDGMSEYRYSDDDMKEAMRMEEPLAGETILKLSDKENECLPYRATYIFHKRKRNEIALAELDIERLYRSISVRAIIKNTLNQYVDRSSIYRDKSFYFLEFPSDFTKKKLNDFLTKNNFRNCFIEDEHFEFFKSNTFKLFAEVEHPIMLDLPLAKGKKDELAHCMYMLFKKYEEENKNYSKLDLSKNSYAQILFCNFSEYRKNKTPNSTYKSTLSNVYRRIR